MTRNHILLSSLNMSGKVCLSLLNEDGEEWIPSMTIKQTLRSIQTLLHEPYIREPAQVDSYLDFYYNKERYQNNVGIQACRFHVFRPPPSFPRPAVGWIGAQLTLVIINFSDGRESQEES